MKALLFGLLFLISVSGLAARPKVPIGRILDTGEKWMELNDSQKYEESWAETGTFFKSRMNAAAWRKAMTIDRMDLGRFLSREFKSCEVSDSIPGMADGQYVTFQFRASFEKKKEMRESLTLMLEADGNWRVIGYRTM